MVMRAGTTLCGHNVRPKPGVGTVVEQVLNSFVSKNEGKMPNT